MLVARDDIFFSAEGAYQHEQRRLGQVEIRQHCTDDPEIKSRIDEQVSFARPGLNATTIPRREFQSTHCRGSHCNHPTSFIERADYLVRCLYRDAVTLPVQFVLLDFFDTHRLKRPQADVQADFRRLDSMIADTL